MSKRVRKKEKSVVVYTLSWQTVLAHKSGWMDASPEMWVRIRCTSIEQVEHAIAVFKSRIGEWITRAIPGKHPYWQQWFLDMGPCVGAPWLGSTTSHYAVGAKYETWREEKTVRPMPSLTRLDDGKDE